MTQKKLSRNYCPLTKNFYVILLQSQFRQSGMSVIFIGLRKLHWHFLKNARIQGSSQWFSAILITLFVWCCDSCVARYWSKRESVSSMPVHSERKLRFLVGFTYDVVTYLCLLHILKMFLKPVWVGKMHGLELLHIPSCHVFCKRCFRAWIAVWGIKTNQATGCTQCCPGSHDAHTA